MFKTAYEVREEAIQALMPLKIIPTLTALTIEAFGLDKKEVTTEDAENFFLRSHMLAMALWYIEIFTAKAIDAIEDMDIKKEAQADKPTTEATTQL